MLIPKLDLKSDKAFTLIELMIVVAIVGILTAIAYPSFQASIIKSRRADAKGALSGLANAMERHFTENNTYCGAGTRHSGGCLTATGKPTIYANSTAYYNLTINTATATSYTLFATPINTQASDQCGTLSWDETGKKDISGSGDCW